MTVRMIFLVLVLLACSGICHGKEGRWNNFAEDSDLKYYLDEKSVTPLPDNVYIFWVKSIAKDKDYFKTEYNLNNLSYIFTNYELDCALSSYRIRGTIMFDKNRREIYKSIPAAGETVFEPVPPESMLELVQDEVCVREETASKVKGSEEQSAEAPAAPTGPASPIAPTAPDTPVESVESGAHTEPPAPAEPPTIQ